MNESPLQAVKEELSQPELVSPACDVLYNDILAQGLVCRKSISGCLVCGAEYSSIVPLDERNLIEVAGRGLISTFYCVIPDNISSNIQPNDQIIVSHDECSDNCIVLTVGELVKVKRQRLGLYGELLPKFNRKITSDDLDILDKNKHDEIRAKESFKNKVCKYKLNMKLVDVHFQFDRNKLFFFFTSDSRVDFRELAKDLASEFKTRIELRQIGVRDEAKKIGGLGVCGREYCCTAFLGNFRRISSHLASEQNLPSNFSKLSGPCGKLKCCLSFEVEQYVTETSFMPKET